MSIIRHEKQFYELISDVVSETIIPQDNDEIFIKELNRSFVWRNWSSLISDSSSIIDQTSVTAQWRWIAEDVLLWKWDTSNPSILKTNKKYIITVPGAYELPNNSQLWDSVTIYLPESVNITIDNNEWVNYKKL